MHSTKQIHQIAKHLRHLRFSGPILIHAVFTTESRRLLFAKPSAAYAGTYTSGEIPVGVIATSDSLSQPGRFVPVAIIYPLAVVSLTSRSVGEAHLYLWKIIHQPKKNRSCWGDSLQMDGWIDGWMDRWMDG